MLTAILMMAALGIIAFGIIFIYFVGQHLFRRHQLKKKQVGTNKKPPSLPLDVNRQLEILNNGEELFPRLLKKIEQATRYVHLLSFIVKNDQLAHQLFETMVKKAKEGVDVRLLVDGLGSLKLVRSGVPERLKAQGVKCAVFAPLSWRHLLNINDRNHRKLAVIDGQSAFVGGLNIGREYVHQDPQLGYWRDIHLYIEGESVRKLEQIFATDWQAATGEWPNREAAAPCPSAPLKGDDPSAILAQVVASGPQENHPLNKESYLSAINRARQRVWLGTPYFVPDQELLAALCSAKKRGVDVQLIVPERTDKTLVHYASFAPLKRLLNTGIPVYLYCKGFYHAKFAVVDDSPIIVGSSNLDQRSFMYSYETDLLIYNRRLAKEAMRLYQSDLKVCRRLTLEELASRPVWQKAASRIASLLSPWL